MLTTPPPSSCCPWPWTSNCPKPERVEPDKAFGVALIVGTFVFFEGSDGFVKKCVRGGPANYLHIPLVETQPDPSVDPLLRVVNSRLEHFSFWAKPVTVVDQLRISRHEFILEVGDASIQRDRLDGPMCLKQDRSTGSFVSTSGLHTHVSVLDDVSTADSVDPAYPV